jgi:hypothetical protein
MTTRLTAPLLALLFVAALPCAAEEETVPAGFVNPWANRKVGEWVELESVSKGPLGEDCASWKLTLVAKGEKSLTMRMDFKKNGKDMSIENPAEPGPFLGRTLQWKETGKEVVEVDGRKLESRILERTDVQEGRVVRSWRAPVNGKEEVVKSIDTSKDSDGKSFSLSFSILHFRDDVVIAGEKVPCRVVESVWVDKSSEKEFRKTDTRWETDRIPVGYAREVTKIADGKTETVETTSVKGFGAGKAD